MSISRRKLIQVVGGAVALGQLTPVRAGAPSTPAGAPKEGTFAIPAGTMPKRKLGRTGVEVSLLGLGGFHIGIPKEDRVAERIMHAAIDHGVTFFDNCWDYHKGKSEERMGRALAGGKRQQVFLMTKLDARNGKATTAQLEQSLRRLQTDVIDLVQVHEVIRMNDADRCFAPDSTIAALLAAKRAGKIRFIGFTGHKSPAIHMNMLRTAARHQVHFDTVQMPLNVMDPHYQSFELGVLPTLVNEGIGVLGMKPLGSGILLQSGVVTATECLRYAMSLPTSVVITGCDTMGVLEQALSIAIGFMPLAKEAMQALRERTKQVGVDGKLERFKTSEQFDGTVENPKWLEKAEL